MIDGRSDPEGDPADRSPGVAEDAPGTGGRAADGGRRPSRPPDEPWAWGERRRRGGGTWGGPAGAESGQAGDGHGPGRRRWAKAARSGPRPTWLPAEEPWPPRRHRPWRRFGCLFGILFLAGVLGLLSIGTSLVGRILETPGPGGFVVRIASVIVVVAIVTALLRAARTIRGSGTVLDALVDQASRVEAGDYSARVETSGTMPGPVHALARGFNTMAARLEADEAQRRSLLADVTHELRTPLAVVQGSVEAILDGIHPADEAHLSAILDETRTLDRLIEDLRTLALSESGALSLHREPTDLGILVGEVATAFAATAGATGVELTARVEDDLPLLEIDPVRIREVIGNLVANAVRHTPAGGRVEIEARPSAPLRGSPGSDVEITVRDTGPGIPAELLPRVFERFARGAGSTGSGLGLSIARGLVELHGGTIEARTPPGGGTEIRVRLPVAPVAGSSVLR